MIHSFLGMVIKPGEDIMADQRYVSDLTVVLRMGLRGIEDTVDGVGIGKGVHVDPVHLFGDEMILSSREEQDILGDSIWLGVFGVHI